MPTANSLVTESLTRQAAANLVALFAALEPVAVESAPLAEEVAPVLPAVKPFKSDRAAKIAYGKAERAYEAARGVRFAAERSRGEVEPTADESARLGALREAFESIDEGRRYESTAFKGYCALWNEISDRPIKAAQEIEDAAWAQMKAVYEQAERQGFYVKSWHLGHNPTRDLIAANMD